MHYKNHKTIAIIETITLLVIFGTAIGVLISKGSLVKALSLLTGHY